MIKRVTVFAVMSFTVMTLRHGPQVLQQLCQWPQVNLALPLDLGIITRIGATAIYTEGPLLEGTFFVISHYMFRPNWPSSGVTG
jgi:hypothetical protein